MTPSAVILRRRDQLRLLLFLLASSLLIGCGEKIAQSDWERLAAIRAEAEFCRSAYTEALWLADLSMGSEKLWEVRERCRLLPVTENIDLLAAIEQHFGRGPEADRVRLLRLALTEARRVLLSELEQAEVDTAEGPTSACSTAVSMFVQLERTLAVEQDRRQRREEYLALLADLPGTNAHRAGILRQQDSLLISLGYESNLDFLVRLHRVDLEELSNLARRLLQETDSLYAALLTELTPQHLGIPADSFTLYDRARFCRGAAFDRYFPADSMVPRLDKLLAEWGLGVAAEEAFTIAITGRSRQQDEARVYAVNLPEKIMISRPARDGWPTSASFYHAVGRALQYYFTTARDFETRYLGDNATAEAFGRFFSGALIEGLSRGHRMPDEDAERFARYRRLVRLMGLRGSCVSLLYEQLLYGAAGDARKVFADAMQRALGVRLTEKEHELYIDLANCLGAADILRGELLAAALRERLNESYGADYLVNAESGVFLRRLWSRGHSLSAQQMLKALELEHLRVEPLLRDLMSDN